MLISLTVAFPIGILSATHRNSPIDGFGTMFALFGICMPNFLIALLLIYVFGVTLALAADLGVPDPLRTGRRLRSLTLPAITLGLALAAVVTRTPALEPAGGALRGLRPDGPRQGPGGELVIRRHALKNGADPGRDDPRPPARHADRRRRHHRVHLRAARGRPARGDAIFARDYPLVQGVILLIAIGFVLSNLLVDIVYGWLDPRIRYG